MRRASPRSAAVVMVMVTLLSGCATSSDGPGATPAPTAAAAAPGTLTSIADPDDINPERLAPLLGLRACDPPPTGPPDLDAGELPLPEAAVLTTSTVDGQLLAAQGYSERTPVEIMVAYLRLEGWTALNAEDEVFEAEMLVERDGLRVFIKAQAVCDRGSAFVMFGSTDEALVPAPAGAGG